MDVRITKDCFEVGIDCNLRYTPFIGVYWNLNAKNDVFITDDFYLNYPKALILYTIY